MNNMTDTKKLPHAHQMGASVNALFEEEKHGDVHIDEIVIHEQDRTVFEDEEHQLLDLGKSLLEHWLQPVVVNVVDDVYHLVAGERRIRAARLVGIEQIPVRFFRDLSLAEAEAIQTAENIQRKNLESFEAAKRVKMIYERLGKNVTDTAAELKKPKSYVSKMLALLDLGPVAKSLVADKLSSDTEVIVQLRNLEKVDPAAAADAVQTIRDSKNSKDPDKKKVVARDVVKRATSDAKPARKPKSGKAGKTSTGEEGDDSDRIATARDESQKEPSGSRMFGSFSQPSEGAKTKTADPLDELSDLDRTAMQSRLKEFWDAGRVATTENPAVALLQGMSEGLYGSKGEAALRLSAFVQGLTLNQAFVLEEVISAVKEAGSA